MKWWREYGFTVQEIADHMGISKARVRQLNERKSPRVWLAIKDLQMAEKLAERARKVRRTGK